MYIVFYYWDFSYNFLSTNILNIFFLKVNIFNIIFLILIFLIVAFLVYFILILTFLIKEIWNIDSFNMFFNKNNFATIYFNTNIFSISNWKLVLLIYLFRTKLFCIFLTIIIFIKKKFENIYKNYNSGFFYKNNRTLLNYVCFLKLEIIIIFY